MTRQDERMRLRKRLIETAIDHAVNNAWQEAIDTNLRVIELGSDADTLNRLGKAYLELGQYERALEYYNDTLRANPTNVIARKNVARLGHLQGMANNQRQNLRQHADPQIFIVETGKTALTTLTNLAPNDVVLRLTTGEQLQIEADDDSKTVQLRDGEGNIIGALEPQLARRLIDMMRKRDGEPHSGNGYAAVVANLDQGMVKVLIREIYQAPENRTMVSFPGKLGGDIAQFRTYVRDAARFDVEADDLAEEDDIVEEDTTDEGDEDFFRGNNEEEEVGLEEIEADISPEDEEEES